MKAKIATENGFKETEMGLIPQDWEVVKFGDIADYNLGRTPPRKDKIYWEDGIIPWVSIADMKDNEVIIDTKEKVSKEALIKIFRKSVVKKNTLLMSFKLTIGRTAILGIDAEHNEAIISIHPEANTDKMFLFYYLPSVDYTQYQDRAIKGNTLNKSKIDKIIVPLPPIIEQQKIAFVLTKIKQVIEQQDKIIQTTKELKKSLMNKLFTEGLHGEEQKETEIGLIPKSWDVVTVGDACEKPQYGYTETSTDKPIGPKFLRITDITEKGVNWAEVPYCKCPKDLIEKYKLARKDIMFARIGATTGKSYIIEDCPLAVYASYLIRVRTKQKTYSNYLYYFFNSEMYWQQINANKGNSLKMGVNGSILASLKFPLPKIEEQKEIANILLNIDKKLSQTESRKQTLQSLFKTMLNQLMTGKVRVKSLNIEVN